MCELGKLFGFEHPIEDVFQVSDVYGSKSFMKTKNVSDSFTIMFKNPLSVIEVACLMNRSFPQFIHHFCVEGTSRTSIKCSFQS